MKPLLSLAVAAALVAAAGASASAQTAPGYAYVADSKFGLFSTVDGKPSFRETDEVPHQTGQQFGWAMRLTTDKLKVHVREELLLPAPATAWTVGGKLPDGMTVAPDRRSAVFERDVPVANGLIANVWTVAANDPTGDYMIRVTVEGTLRQFNFTVR